jgi:flagellar M-ring protein FliF
MNDNADAFSSYLRSRASRPWLIAAVAGLLVFAAGLFWLLRTPHAPLEMPADAAARQDLLHALQSAGIDYRINGDAAVEVPANALAQARQLTGASDHAFPAAPGFELLDSSDYTLSDFAQRLNYQRALEGELARTLAGLREVRSARVHLSLPKTELFAAQKTPAKAAVTLQLTPGEQLSGEAAAGIREIVAAAVEGLKPDQVSLIDDQGNTLAAAAGGSSSLELRTRAVRRLEFDLERRVRQLLQDTWGIANPYVSVRAELNFDRVTAVRDGAVPTTDAVGMLTREQVSDAAPARDDGVTTSTATREYVYTRERVETEFSSGRLARLDIAVALPAGYAAHDALQLERVIAAAIGLQAERGDRLVVSLTPLLQPMANAAHAPATGAPAASPAASGVTAGESNESDAAAALASASDSSSASATDDASSVRARAVASSLIDLAREPAWLLLLAFALAGAVYLTMRQRAAATHMARMTPAQREQLLADLRRWLEAP